MSSSSSGPALPTLIVTGGASDGLQVPLEAPGAEKSIGSGPTSHVRLTGRNVDFSHARISWEDAAVLLSDEGSAAGTFVNGEKVGVGHVLQDGDRISIGPPGSPESVKLLVRVPPDLASAAALPGMFGAEETAFAGTSDDDALVFTDPASPEQFTPAFSAPEAGDAGTDDAIIFDEAAEEPAPPAAPPPAPPPPVAAAPAPAAARAPTAAPTAAKPAPAIPTIPAAAAAPARTPRAPAARPDYMSEIPSIGGDRVREAPEVPSADAGVARAAFTRPKLPSFDLSRIPRAAIVAVAAAVLGIGGFYAFSRSQEPPPVLSGVTPPKVEVGTTVTLIGTGFATSASDNTVRFGDKVGTVTSSSGTSLTVTVPEVSVPAGKGVPVTVTRGGGRSNALFVKIARLPRIVRIEPDVAVPGTEITVVGQNFEGPKVTVKIGGERVEVTDPKPDALRVTVPEMSWTDGQSVSLTVEVGPDTARAMPLLMGRLPLVVEVVPAHGQIGQRFAIKGRGFEPTPAGNRVTVGGTPALVLAASPTELQVSAPAAATTGSQAQLPVVVETRGASSSGRATFALSHPLSGYARLRFFPALADPSAPDRHLFVSTEIGPVLVLTGKADASSTPERAERVATALTGLLESASSRPVTLEVREGATPAVAVAGGPVIVTATPDDVEGYAQAWDTGARPTRGTPRQIATFWTALLQDYVALFGLGQRPSRTAELTPRGKVLVDIFAEAQRRGASGGVPVATVYQLSPAALKSAREMALILPAGGGTSAGTAVAGRWEGMMADTEAERRIEVQLQVDGNRLAGSLMTKTGAIAVRTPLQEVSYDKGLLKFVLASGGGVRQFRGTLDGGTLSGSIFKDTSGKDAVGRFSLRYVE